MCNRIKNGIFFKKSEKFPKKNFHGPMDVVRTTSGRRPDDLFLDDHGRRPDDVHGPLFSPQLQFLSKTKKYQKLEPICKICSVRKFKNAIFAFFHV